MALSAGTRVGSYEILAPLGAGGMGEVYRATDMKLGRDVAIKVLPAEVAQDAERLARFEREAKLLASLNHPNIAHVYGFESATLPGGEAAFSAAVNGVLVAYDSMDARMRPLVWVGPSNQVTGTVPLRGERWAWTYAVSHGGRQVALGGFGMRLFDVQRAVSNAIPVEEQSPQVTSFPAWSRDDTQLAYQSPYSEPPALRVYRLADGRTRTLFESPGRPMHGANWSPDDTEIAFWRKPGQGVKQPEVWVYSVSTGQARPLFASTTGALWFDGRCRFCLEFSSAGRGLVYWSTESGAPEVYLRPYPAAGPSRQVSADGGHSAHWSADGKTIYYAAPSGSILSVAVGLRPRVSAGHAT